MTTEKTCYACKRILPLDAFCRNRCKRDGRSDECRECKRKIDRKYLGRSANGLRIDLPRSGYREPYFIDPARIEAIRRLLATECKVYWLPSDRRRCPHGCWEEECAECERLERAGMVFALVVEDDES